MLTAVSRCDFYVKIADQNLERFQDETDHPGLVFPPRTRRSLDALRPPSFSPRAAVSFLFFNKQLSKRTVRKEEDHGMRKKEREAVCVRDGPDAQRLTALRWPRFPFWGLFWNDYNFDGSISFIPIRPFFVSNDFFFLPPFFPDDFHRLF